MSKMAKLMCGVLLAFAAVTATHVYLNLKLDKFRFGAAAREENALRVGFLPVT